jgi:hypothetical protein
VEGIARQTAEQFGSVADGRADGIRVMTLITVMGREMVMRVMTAMTAQSAVGAGWPR